MCRIIGVVSLHQSGVVDESRRRRMRDVLGYRGLDDAGLSVEGRLTGTAVLLNTASNLHGYPIVSHPQDAHDGLDRSRLLTQPVIGNWLVEKR